MALYSYFHEAASSTNHRRARHPGNAARQDKKKASVCLATLLFAHGLSIYSYNLSPRRLTQTLHTPLSASSPPSSPLSLAPSPPLSLHSITTATTPPLHPLHHLPPPRNPQPRPPPTPHPHLTAINHRRVIHLRPLLVADSSAALYFAVDGECEEGSWIGAERGRKWGSRSSGAVKPGIISRNPIGWLATVRLSNGSWSWHLLLHSCLLRHLSRQHPRRLALCVAWDWCMEAGAALWMRSEETRDLA